MPDLMLGGKMPVFPTLPKLQNGVKVRNQGGTGFMPESLSFMFISP